MPRLVGENTSQTLTNKTVDGSDNTITDAAPAAHTHVVAGIDATGTPDATTFLRGDGSWQTPAGGGGGQTLVTKTVSATDGDYTTLTDALAAASNGWIIYVKEGTYTEAGAISSSLTDLTIVGASNETSVITAAGNITFSGERVKITNIKLDMGIRILSVTGDESELLDNFISFYNGYITFQSNRGKFCRNKIKQAASGNQFLLSAQGAKSNMVLSNNYFMSAMGNGGETIYVNGNDHVFSNNIVEIDNVGGNGNFILRWLVYNGTVSGNLFHSQYTYTSIPGVQLSGYNNNFVGNTLQNVTRNGGLRVDGLSNTITGNNIDTSANNGVPGINVTAANNVISSNVLYGNTTNSTCIGIRIEANDCIVSSNRIENYHTAIGVISGSTNTSVGMNNTTSSTTGLTDSGTNTQYAERFTKYLIRAAAPQTLDSVTTTQAMFDTPTNGTVTLPVGTYLFDTVISLSSMSATSGNIRYYLLGAGTATLTSVYWIAYGTDSTTGTLAAISGSSSNAAVGAGHLVTASTTTGLQAHLRGTFEVTATGTLIPSVGLMTAAAAVVAAGSYFSCERVGDTGLTHIGPWS